MALIATIIIGVLTLCVIVYDFAYNKGLSDGSGFELTDEKSKVE